MTANFDRISPVQTWIDYQSPPPAFMNLIALYDCKLIVWKPILVQLVAPNNRGVFGLPNWTIEEWIAAINTIAAFPSVEPARGRILR